MTTFKKASLPLFVLLMTFFLTLSLCNNIPEQDRAGYKASALAGENGIFFPA